MTYAQTYLTGWVGERMLADLRTHLFDHLQRLSLGFYERNRAGVIISRLTNDVEALDQLVTDGISTLVQSTLTLVGTAILLFILDWRLALATLAVIPVMSVGTVLFRRYSTRAYRAVRERLGLVTATLAEDIAGMRVVQAFTREQVSIRNFREVSERYRQSNQQTVVLSGRYFPFVDLLSTVALAIVLGYGGHLYFEGAVEIGTLFAFMLYVQNFFDPVQQLSQLYGTFLSATAALDKINDLLDEQPQVVDEPGARDLGHLAGDVRFEGVRFTYGRGDEVLHGIDLDVPAGTTVALVGHTGAGKSTIAKLLARFYDPTHGRITLDGADLRHVTQASLRRQLGVVPQEGFLFAGSVRENIAFGRPDASDDQIVAAATAVGRRRLHQGARERLRHGAGRARLAPVARTAPAGRLRAGAARRPAHPRARRGDLVRRHRHRAADRGRAAEAPRGPDGIHHRASPLDHSRGRSDRRPRARPHRRAGLARRAARPPRAVHEPVRRLGRGRRLSGSRQRPTAWR